MQLILTFLVTLETTTRSIGNFHQIWINLVSQRKICSLYLLKKKILYVKEHGLCRSSKKTANIKNKFSRYKSTKTSLRNIMKAWKIKFKSCRKNCKTKRKEKIVKRRRLKKPTKVSKNRKKNSLMTTSVWSKR